MWEGTVKKYHMNKHYKYLLLEVGLRISDIFQICRTNSYSSKTRNMYLVRPHPIN